MSILHARQDVYLGDDLTWTGVMVIEDRTRKTLRVKRKHKTLGTFTDTFYRGREGLILSWDATDEAGERVVVSSAARPPAKCGHCGGRR